MEQWDLVQIDVITEDGQGADTASADEPQERGQVMAHPQADT